MTLLKIAQRKKKELSTVQKIVIITGLVSVIVLGIEISKYKGKHIEKYWEKLKEKLNKGKKEVEESNTKSKVEEKPKVTETTTLPHVADFRNLSEAKQYFESIGIKTVFKDGTQNHLSDLNSIKNDLLILEKNGVEIPKPESIIVSDWHKEEELKQILLSQNISEHEANSLTSNTWAWGTVQKSTDNKCHVIINSSFSGDYGKFIHEMGHIHQDYLQSSYLHKTVSSEKEFLDKQLEIFGISDIGLHNGYLSNMSSNFGKNRIKSIFRGYTADSADAEIKAKLRRIFPDIGDGDYEKVFSIAGRDGKTYYINAKKMVDKMASESGVYAPTKIWENVAEIFQGLNKGEEYSDLVMLMYDINGGGRVPNLVIKGMKYDDYIKSLYNNQDLIKQLRESIEVKQLH